MTALWDELDASLDQNLGLDLEPWDPNGASPFELMTTSLVFQNTILSSSSQLEARRRDKKKKAEEEVI
jgi:hypothetical protein